MLAPFPLVAATWGNYLELDSLFYSEAVPIHGLLNDWDGENRVGEHAVSLIHVESGVSTGNWQLGLFYRNEYHLRFTPETARFYQDKQLGVPSVSGKIYQLGLHGIQYEVTGLRAGFQFPLNEFFDLTIRGDYLEGQSLRLLDLQASGNLATLSSWRDIHDLQFQQSYSGQDALLDKLGVPEGRQSDGIGYALGLGLSYDQGLLSFQADVDNWLGRIYWDQALKTTLEMQDGTHGTWFPVFPDYGRLGRLTQQLPIEVKIAGQWQTTLDWALTVRTRITKGHQFNWLGVEWNRDSAIRLRGELEPIAKAVGINFEMPWGEIGVSSDNINWRDAHYLALQAQFQFYW